MGDWRHESCPACKANQKTQQENDLENERKKEREYHKKRLFTAKMGRIGISKRHKECTFKSYKPANETAEKIHKSCIDYAENFEENRQLGKSLIFCGTTGTGKTHLSCAIANQIVEQQNKTAVFIRALKIIRSIKDTYSKGCEQTEQQAIDRFLLPDLLIIDEIGVQFGSDTEKMILFEIINDRYESMKPTILISNLALDKLSEFAGDRVIDRMKENGGIIFNFKWESYRGVKASNDQPHIKTA